MRCEHASSSGDLVAVEEPRRYPWSTSVGCPLHHDGNRRRRRSRRRQRYHRYSAMSTGCCCYYYYREEISEQWQGRMAAVVVVACRTQTRPTRSIRAGLAGRARRGQSRDPDRRLRTQHGRGRTMSDEETTS